EMVVSMRIPRPFDLEWPGRLAAIGVTQVRKDAAVFALELLDRIERAGEQACHPRVQRPAGDEQQREAGAGFIITNANGASFVELGRSALSGLLSIDLRCRGRRCDRIHVGAFLNFCLSMISSENRFLPPGQAGGRLFRDHAPALIACFCFTRILIHASGIIPVHHWVNGPTSMSYLRANVSLPSCPIRNTVRPAGMSTTLPSSAPAVGRGGARDEQPRPGMEPEGGRMRGADVGVLNCGWLAGLLIEGNPRDVPPAAVKHHFALHVLHPGTGGRRQA